MNPLFKSLLALAIIIIITITTIHAQTSGSGCYVNGDGVYTQYLGDAPYYGNNADRRPVYLNSKAAGSFVPRNVMGYKPDGNHYNYVCGQINVFDPNPYGPGQNELSIRSNTPDCEVASSRNSPSETASRGHLSTFTYNNPTYCSRSAVPNNVPLDDYLSYLISMSGTLTFLTLRKNPIFNSITL